MSDQVNSAPQEEQEAQASGLLLSVEPLAASAPFSEVDNVDADSDTRDVSDADGADEDATDADGTDGDASDADGTDGDATDGDASDATDIAIDADGTDAG